jgi:hypothetical protein
MDEVNPPRDRKQTDLLETLTGKSELKFDQSLAWRSDRYLPSVSLWIAAFMNTLLPYGSYNHDSTEQGTGGLA